MCLLNRFDGVIHIFAPAPEQSSLISGIILPVCSCVWGAANAFPVDTACTNAARPRCMNAEQYALVGFREMRPRREEWCRSPVVNVGMFLCVLCLEEILEEIEIEL